MPDVFISRQPLVNRQSKIIATRLTLHLDAGATTKDAANTLGALVEFWPQGEKLVFINPGNAPCTTALLEWQIPANATVEVRSASLLEPGAEALIAALQVAQSSLCLVYDAQAQAALACGVPFRFIAFDAQRHTPAQLRILATQTQPYGIGVAFNVNDGPAFQACLDAGVNAAASWFFTHPTKAPARALNPGQAQIVRVLNLAPKPHPVTS